MKKIIDVNVLNKARMFALLIAMFFTTSYTCSE